MQAAAKTNRLSDALVELLAIQAMHRRAWRRLFAGIAYPACILLAAIIVFAGVPMFVIPPFKQLFDEMQLILPMITTVVLWWGEVGVWYMCSSALVALAIMLTAPVVAGRAMTQRLLQALPWVGLIIAWANASRWTLILSVLVRHELPLHEALRWSADGQIDASLAEFSMAAAKRVESGQEFPTVIEDSLVAPQIIAPYA
jgi:general secretion pathway protein F